MSEEQKIHSSNLNVFYPLIIVVGIVGNIVNAFATWQAIYSSLGIFFSTLLIGVGVVGVFVNQRRITMRDGILYGIIWTMLITLAGAGYYILITRPNTVSGILLDNNIARQPVSNVEIRLQGDTGIPLQVPTGTDGSFRFSPVPDGGFNILINGLVVYSGTTTSGWFKLIQGEINLGQFYLDNLRGTPVLSPTPLAAISTSTDNPTVTSVIQTSASINPTPSITASEMIVFSREHNDQRDIYIAPADGSSRPTPILEGNFDDRFPEISPDGTKIAFISDRSGGYDVWLMNFDGSNLERLTDTQDYEWGVSWSPDGQRLVYASWVRGAEDADSNYDLFIMNITTKAIDKITESPLNETFPRWSPDGNYITFNSYIIDDSINDDEINVINLMTGNIIPLTENNVSDADAFWSPDGRHIVFESNRDGNFEIYEMEFETGNIRRLTTNNSGDWDPTYSPDGLYIAYGISSGNSIQIVESETGNPVIRLDNHSDETNDAWPRWKPAGSPLLLPIIAPIANMFGAATPTTVANRPAVTDVPATNSTQAPLTGMIVFHRTTNDDSDIYIAPVEGSSNPTPVLVGNFYDGRAEISPDGTKIAFISDRNGNYDVWIMNLDGSGLERITNTPNPEWGGISWSPDGQKIVYATYTTDGESGNYELYTMDMETRATTRLTNSPLTDLNPFWSPDGNSIAYLSLISGDDTSNDTEINILDLVSGETRQLTDNEVDDSNPFWSPDGEYVVFQSNRDGNYEIYEMEIATGNLRRLTNNNYTDYDPAYSPDGQFIAHYSSASNTIHFISAETGNPIERLENPPDGSRDYWPRWKP